MRKPLSAAIWGIVLGLMIAILLQQHGIWPPDKLTIALLPGGLGLIGVLITGIRGSGSGVAMTIALIITVPLAAYGATGVGDVNEQGVLNGGCQVLAVSSAPGSTTVVDSSKQSPFEIDPDGSLQWAASSPVAFMDYDWQMWVEIGGAQVRIDSGHEGNEGGSQENAGDVANVREYGEARGIPISEMLGVYKVGGDAAGAGGCSGFGFVELISQPFETTAAKVAGAIGVLALIMFVRALMASRALGAGEGLGNGGSDGGNGGGGDTGSAADTAAGGASGVVAPADDSDGDGDKPVPEYEPGAEDLPDRDDLA